MPHSDVARDGSVALIYSSPRPSAWLKTRPVEEERAGNPMARARVGVSSTAWTSHWITALRKVAERLDRDRTYVVTQAIDAFLEVQKWQIEYIEEAMREGQAGEFASTAEVGRTFARLRGRPRMRKTG